MLRYLFLLSLICSLNAFADIILSSPKIKLNAQNQRVIEFRIDSESINDGDVVLNEYKTNNKIDESFIAYTLINNYGNYQTFSIILDDEYIVRAGYSANATIITAKKENVNALSEAVIQYDLETKLPYVEIEVGDQQFERKDIKLGLADGINVEVVSGVSKDDKIKIWDLTKPNKIKGWEK